MNRTMALLLMLGAIVAFGMAAHPLYLSITDMFYNEESKSLEISIKLFQDDLELALEETYGAKELKLGSPYEASNADSLIERYVNRNLRLTQTNSPLQPDYLGKEIDGQAVWVYLEAKDLPKPGTLQVDNRLLGFLIGQRNIVHLRVGEERKSILLQKGYWQNELSFK